MSTNETTPKTITKRCHCCGQKFQDTVGRRGAHRVHCSKECSQAMRHLRSYMRHMARLRGDVADTPKTAATEPASSQDRGRVLSHLRREAEAVKALGREILGQGRELQHLASKEYEDAWQTPKAVLQDVQAKNN